MRTLRRLYRQRQTGVAMPISLIIVAIMLIVATALFRATRSDLLSGANEGDRVIARQASDAGLKTLLDEMRRLPAIPEIVDPSGASLPWWNSNPAAIAPAFWTSCASAPPPNRCAEETITRAGRTLRVQRMIQPNGTPDENTASSNSMAFYYRAAVLVTMVESGARSEVESYVRRPQIIRK